MAELLNRDEGPASRTEALESIHNVLLDALRHREQEIVRYLAILGPALGCFIWLLHAGTERVTVFTAGTMGVLLLLFLGAVYSLALGYNYRYVTLELAKLETMLGIKNAMLAGWPKTRQGFLDHYRLWRVPWCTPPEVIKVFWLAFLVGIAGVTITVWTYEPGALVLWLVRPTGVACFLVGLLLPVRLGSKLHVLCSKEANSW